MKIFYMLLILHSESYTGKFQPNYDAGGLSASKSAAMTHLKFKDIQNCKTMKLEIQKLPNFKAWCIKGYTK